MRRCLPLLLCLLLTAAPWAAAQDPTEVDPDHYSVILENEQVRVLRISYGPGEKSVMHYHPAGVSVFLDELKGQFTMPDGTTHMVEGKAGETALTPGGYHLPENLGDQPFTVIQMELKGAAMTEEDVAAIGRVRDMEAEGVGSGDPETGVGAYADDVVFMAPGEPELHGKDSVRAWLAAVSEQFDLDVDYTSSDITVAGPWAFEHYAGTATFTPKQGGDAVVEQLKGIHVYHRGTDGAWRITHDTWNTDAPPPGME